MIDGRVDGLIEHLYVVCRHGAFYDVYKEDGNDSHFRLPFKCLTLFKLIKKRLGEYFYVFPCLSHHRSWYERHIGDLLGCCQPQSLIRKHSHYTNDRIFLITVIMHEVCTFLSNGQSTTAGPSTKVSVTICRCRRR